MQLSQYFVVPVRFVNADEKILLVNPELFLHNDKIILAFLQEKSGCLLSNYVGKAIYLSCYWII